MALRVLVVLALLSSVAQAETKPWAVGVSASEQKAALRLYETANELFEKGNYLDALPIYEQALAHWDHPAIHYNTVVCLINLDRALEAHVHLQKALAFGEAPLGPDMFAQGRRYQESLAKKIGTLEVVLVTPGATVQLDAAPLLDAPGTVTRQLLVSEPHQIVARKPGYDDDTRTVEIKPGATERIVIDLKLKPRGRTERRWARWVPWAVVGVGAAFGVVGGVFVNSARTGFEDYDTQFDALCPTGCRPDSMNAETLADMKSSAERSQTLAYSAWAVGGVAVVSGLVLVVMNQPRLVRTTVTPTVGRDTVGAVLSTSW